MTNVVIPWIAAEAIPPGFRAERLTPRRTLASDHAALKELAERLPAGALTKEAREHDPDLWLYRDRTLGMLRRYLRISIEVGRLPSLLGREFFRTRVTSYSVATFEDAVIFVHDVERILDQLYEFDKSLVVRILFQNYSYTETARLLKCGKRTVGRRFLDVIDRVSGLFLAAGLLDRMNPPSESCGKTCQEGKTVDIDVSD
jgi:hypothetical protein